MAAVARLADALLGIHAGLERCPDLPAHDPGVAIYCEWDTDEAEWQHRRQH